MVYKESILEKLIQLALFMFLTIWVAGNLAWFYINQYWGYIVAAILAVTIIGTVVIALGGFTIYVGYRVYKDIVMKQTSIYQ